MFPFPACYSSMYDAKRLQTSLQNHREPCQTCIITSCHFCSFEAFFAFSKRRILKGEMNLLYVDEGYERMNDRLSVAKI